MSWEGIRLPNMDDIDLSDKKQVRRLYSYLYKLDEQLRFALNNIDEENLGVKLRALIDSKASGEDVESLIRQSAGEILIVVRKPASEVDTGGDGGVSVRISKDKFEVNVPGEDGDFELNESGGRLPVLVGDDISAPNVSPRYVGSRLLTVNPNATAEQMTEWGIFRNLADALATVNGRQLEGKLQINVADGAVMYGDAAITGVCGGEIEINGVDAMLYGHMTVKENSTAVYINKMGITSAEGSALRVSGAGEMVHLWACPIVSTAGDALEGSDGAKVDAVECRIVSESGKAAYLMRTAFGAFENCVGKGVLAARKAMLSAVGTVPDGGCEDWDGAIISAANTVPTGTDGEPAAPQVETLTFELAHSDSYAGSGWSYFDDDDVRQGWINGNRIRGCMWFDNAALRTALDGKTVEQASLRLYAQKNVGRGVAVTVELWGTATEYDGRGTPELTKEYGVIGSIEPGTVTTITIPVQAAADLAAGVINGFMLYSADDAAYKDRAYSRNYARFDGEKGTEIPMLTVTASAPRATEEE